MARRRKNLDKILVVDIEATCWERCKEVKGQRQEIIEIGVCHLDVKTLEVTRPRALFVTPEHSTVSDYCTELTSITPEMLDEEGISFEAACELLKSQYGSVSRPWASYGDFDRTAFETDCRRNQVNYPFGKSHINIKSLLALSHGWAHEVGMARALKDLGLILEGRHHRGVDDAVNAAKILATTFKMVRSIDA